MNKDIINLLKTIPGLHPAAKFAKGFTLEVQAGMRHLAERRIPRGDGPIRVGFLCQYLPAWTKIQDIYLKMQKDPRFETYLLCVPSGIYDCKLTDPSDLSNDAYEYCLQHGFPEAINTRTAKDSWLDLKSLNLEYIFYSRPYDHLLPACYGSAEVSKYSKICFSIYGITLTEEGHGLMGKRFMSNTYFYFAEFEETRDYNIRQNPLLHRLGLIKSECLGYPMLEHMMKYRDTESESWAFSQNGGFRVLWTPRWTSELKNGGSNFQNFVPPLLKYAKDHPDVDILHRPHPFTFDHFVSTGKMTAAEIEAYKQECRTLANTHLDHQTGYEATLWGADAFVTDLSSMITEFLIAGKPILHCETGHSLTYEPYMERMLEGCYIIHNEQELIQTIEQLKHGHDPLREIREAVRNELIALWDTEDNTRILNALAVKKR